MKTEECAAVQNRQDFILLSLFFCQSSILPIIPWLHLEPVSEDEFCHHREGCEAVCLLALVLLVREIGRLVLQASVQMLEPINIHAMPKDLCFQCGGYWKTWLHFELTSQLLQSTIKLRHKLAPWRDYTQRYGL